jgi:hypothetical protein
MGVHVEESRQHRPASKIDRVLASHVGGIADPGERAVDYSKGRSEVSLVFAGEDLAVDVKLTAHACPPFRCP